MGLRRSTARDRLPGVAGFKFEPRMMVLMPKAFGRSSGPMPPALDVDPLDPRFRAAQLQHRIANAVREEVLEQGSSLEQFLSSMDPVPPGMSYDRVIRIQRGETLMQLADVVTWASAFERVRKIIIDELGAMRAIPQDATPGLEQP
jgi:hypothetical protein